MEIIQNPDRQFALSPQQMRQGCINVIRLDSLKRVSGARWDRTRQSVCAHLDTICKRLLAPTDYYAEVDDTAYFISTPSRTREEARTLCLRIASELYENQLGRCDVAALQIAEIQKCDGRKLFCEPVESSELIRLFSGAGVERRILPAAANSAPYSIPPNAAPMRFTPVWDMQQEAVTMYRCTTLSDIYSTEGVVAQAQRETELKDLFSRFNYMTKCLARHLAAGEKFLISFPISYEFLGTPLVRMEISGLCRNLPSALRPYLLFEISDLPFGVPQSRLSELVGSLRPFCRGVSAILPARIPSYGAYLGAGLAMIGLSLSPQLVGATEMESEIFKLSAAAKRLHLKSVVLDVRNIETLLAARSNGVNFVTSPMVGRPAADPAPVSRLHLSQVEANAQNLKDAPVFAKTAA